MTNVADPHRKRAYDTAYYAANKDRAKDYMRQYYAANKRRISESRTQVRKACPEVPLWRGAKERATKLGLPFDITIADVIIPQKCPILGIPLASGAGRCGPNSPSLDRINPSRGYVRGNIAVISHRANTIKNDATPKELAAVLDWVIAQSKIDPNAH